MKRYNPVEVEQKWQDIWAREKTYAAADDDKTREKLYCAEMFPYPSGAGLHVGHVRNFTIVDTLARFYRLQGYNVMRPFGYDTFGLPAENYAIKTGISPRETTITNINHFREQVKRMGMAVDWDREIDTTDTGYYRWTQWIFTKLFEKGLAYQAENYQWWCPVDKTVLANEQVEAGKCWRCHSEVEKKKMRQWFFKITDYADELLDKIDDLDWPEKIKTMQRNWIGRSNGAEVDFQIANDTARKIKVFTTRPDTLFGATFMVLAPEHPIVASVTKDKQRKIVDQYREETMKKSEIQRQENREKTGVFTGEYAINPINGEKIPIWIADYVLMGYGTGAIMAVPAHDERDYEFAQKHNLPIVAVIDQPETSTEAGCEKGACYAGEGELVNSGQFNGTSTFDAREQIVAWLEQQKLGQMKTTYRMHDWLISRQRYWGAPIPIIHCPKDGAVAVPEKDLPVELPPIEDYKPAGDGKSPLAKVTDWVNTTCPKCGGPAKRETDTMDGYACSSWYLLRYCDPRDAERAWDPAKVNAWSPVDFYVGGDHAVAHLLYVRFWTKFFADEKLINFREPVKKLLYNGYINASDGRKMSKSWGNVIDPLEVIDSGYGADTLRTYEMFIGPYDLDAAWNTNSIGGVYRFLNRIWTLVQEFLESTEKGQPTDSTELVRARHLAVKKVSEDLYHANFNTAVAALMEYTNSLYKFKEAGFADKEIWREVLNTLCQLLAPFAPHITSELFAQLNGDDARLESVDWPTWDEKYLTTDEMTIAIQVNGKLRGEITVAAGAPQDEIENLALKNENVAKFVADKTPAKVIYVPGKIVNIVVE